MYSLHEVINERGRTRVVLASRATQQTLNCGQAFSATEKYLVISLVEHLLLLSF